MKLRVKGFTLLEVLVATTLLVVILTGAFFLFRMGTRGFYKAINKTGAVGEIQRATRILQKDIELTHFSSVSIHARTVSGYSRDGLAVAGLSNWSDSSNFEAGTELPNWDRWSIFYATGEVSAKLYRMEIDRDHPKGSFYPLVPLANLVDYMADDPLSVKGSNRVTRLCDNVREFAISTDNGYRLVKVRLVLTTQLGKQMQTQKNLTETLETEYEIVPLNSYPEM